MASAFADTAQKVIRRQKQKAETILFWPGIRISKTTSRGWNNVRTLYPCDVSAIQGTRGVTSSAVLWMASPG